MGGSFTEAAPSYWDGLADQLQSPPPNLRSPTLAWTGETKSPTIINITLRSLPIQF